MKHRVTVFDPPLCCSTGVCGVDVDPALSRFVADLDLLRSRGYAVRRYNLAQEPEAFVASAVVKSALATRGTACLPMVLLDGVVVSEGRYPGRAQLLGDAPAPGACAEVAGGGGCCE